MKKLLPLLLSLFSVVAANAQTSCNASLTWTQLPNTHDIQFTNTSTVAVTGPSTPFASTNRGVIIAGALYNANPNYTYTFPGPGTYTVAAQVSYLDSVNGVAVYCSDTTQYTVTVVAGPCYTTFSSTGTGGTYTFTASSPGATPGSVSYTWTIQAGNSTSAVTLTGNPVTHTIPYSHGYTVSVVATAGGCVDTATSYIQLSAPLNCSIVNASFIWMGSGNTRTFYPTNSTNTAFYDRTNYWNFGNGSTAVTSGLTSATTTYSLPGNYNVCLVSVWTDSLNNTCADTFCQNVVVGSGGTPFNCATANTTFTTYGQGYSRTFVPAVSPSNPSGVSVLHDWNFGDGSVAASSLGSEIHHYTLSGTYNVCLVTKWFVAGTTTLLCADTFCQTVSVTVPNVINGWVLADSLPSQLVDTFKVWLISYDPSTSMLTAVDSIKVHGISYAQFSFAGKPAGIYRTKAQVLTQPLSSAGYVPTYRDSSLTWSGAQTFQHNNGMTYGGGIFMRQGLVTSGPGFVGGSVLSGANKGTADGDPVANQLVFLRDAATGALVQSAYTNNAGQYSFSNIPLGSYTVYPEEMNYATTPSAPLTLTASNASVSGILFKKDDVGMDIKQVTTGVRNINSGALTISLTPNPTSGKVVLSIGQAAKANTATVRITSLTGQVVFTGNVSAGRSNELNLSHLNAGVYTVSVSTDAAVSTSKLVITR